MEKSKTPIDLTGGGAIIMNNADRFDICKNYNLYDLMYNNYIFHRFTHSIRWNQV